jgi:hypothetical protein
MAALYERRISILEKERRSQAAAIVKISSRI